ncbi:MAG TPA: hypothetical protein PKU69_04870 [Bacillota bacterium]|nr:hypothetical protein [Bacillota bacterium]
MDVLSHKKLAENALIKAKEMLETNDKSLHLTILHFAHVARLHYEYSSMDKSDEEYLKNMAEADDFLIEVCHKIGLEDTAKFIENNR